MSGKDDKSSSADDAICAACYSGDDEALLVLCDGAGCGKAFHTYCWKNCMCCTKRTSDFNRDPPPIPEGKWYCKFCRGRTPVAADGVDPASNKHKDWMVYASGNNEGGQLGIGLQGRPSNQLMPVPVNDLTGLDIVEIACGGWNTIVLTAEGICYTCGDGEHGKTGHFDVTHEMLRRFRLVEKLTAENMSMGEGAIVKVAAGRDFMMAVTSEGHPYTWGLGDQGKLAHQSNADKKIPTKISAFREQEIPVTSVIALGYSHSMCTTADHGEFVSWGSNRTGQLATGASNQSDWVPQIVNPSKKRVLTTGSDPKPTGAGVFPIGYNIIQLSCGKMHSMALTSDGRVFTWGAGLTGQLGLGKDAAIVAANRGKPVFQQAVEYKNSPRPQMVTAGGLSSKNVTAISAGGDHCLAFVASGDAAGTGAVYSWGFNRFGQCAQGASLANVDLPTEIKSLADKKIHSVATGDNHSLALSTDGVAYSWGQSNMGQCGTGKQSDVREPTAVTQVFGSAPAMQQPVYTKPVDKKQSFAAKQAAAAAAPKPAPAAAAAPAAPAAKPVPVPVPKFAAIFAGGDMSWFLTHITTRDEARKIQKAAKKKADAAAEKEAEANPKKKAAAKGKGKKGKKAAAAAAGGDDTEDDDADAEAGGDDDDDDDDSDASGDEKSKKKKSSGKKKTAKRKSKADDDGDDDEDDDDDEGDDDKKKPKKKAKSSSSAAAASAGKKKKK